MARLMSVALTEPAVRARTKTQTRRLGWSNLRAGEELRLVRKAMGRSRVLPDGSRYVEPLVDVARVRVVEVRRERLDAITDEDVAREGFELGPDEHPAAWFVAFFTEHMRCAPDAEVTVITWEYL